MKKALILLTVFALLAVVSTAYACGEKSGSKADATQSKTEMTAASEATVTPAVVTTEKDASVTKADYSGCAGKAGVSKASADGHCAAMKTEVSKASAGSGCCPGKAGVRAEQAVVRKAGSETYDCPASPSCPTPCNKDVKSSAAKSSSASVDKESESEKVISISAEASPDAGTLK